MERVRAVGSCPLATPRFRVVLALCTHLSNSFLMYCAMSFSTVKSSNAFCAISMAAACRLSDMSTALTCCYMRPGQSPASVGDRDDRDGNRWTKAERLTTTLGVSPSVFSMAMLAGLVLQWWRSWS